MSTKEIKQRKPVHFEPEKLFPSEKWKDITQQIMPNIKPYYIVSNYGRVYNWIEERFITPYETSNHLYCHIRCTDDKGNGSYDRTRPIHRLMMMAFNYFPGCENYEVDHIDECSYNNFLDNMQWLTREQNIRKTMDAEYSRKTLTQIKGIDSPHAKMNDEIVTRICELLANTNLTLREIADSFNSNISYSDVRNIAIRKTWKHISCNYSWTHREKRNNND